ncbi:hypothetical protein BCU02_25815 [Vibrio lentus]|nr:hypothetical protein BCU02_25815 [Vibrio lentus]
MSLQTNGICERFHKTILNEFYQITFRKKLYGSMEELQKDLDEWITTTIIVFIKEKCAVAEHQ